jgi:hypothetical protein
MQNSNGRLGGNMMNTLEKSNKNLPILTNNNFNKSLNRSHNSNSLKNQKNGLATSIEPYPQLPPILAKKQCAPLSDEERLQPQPAQPVPVSQTPDGGWL